MSVGGAPLDETRRYVVATHDFLAAGGNGYTAFAGHEPVYNDSGRWLRDVLAEWWRRRGSVRTPPTAGSRRSGPEPRAHPLQRRGAAARPRPAGAQPADPRQVELVQRGELVVLDAEGRERGLDGALPDGLALRLAPRPRA